MRHLITIQYEVEAPAWDLAVEKILREPVPFLVTCKVKPYRKSLIHVSRETIRFAAQQIADEPT